MSLFRSRKATERLLGRLDAHEERLDDMRRDLRTLKLEWEETYDKIHRLFGRIAKRTAIDSPPPPPPPAKDDPQMDLVDEISRKIHERRAMGRP